MVAMVAMSAKAPSCLTLLMALLDLRTSERK